MKRERLENIWGRDMLENCEDNHVQSKMEISEEIRSRVRVCEGRGEVWEGWRVKGFGREI